jgi:carnitine O-acetyltransferase
VDGVLRQVTKKTMERLSYISVPRFAADIFIDDLLLMARSINPKALTLFKATLFPLSKSGAKTSNADSGNVSLEPHHTFNTVSRKLEWSLTPEINIGIRFAKIRLSDLIGQNDIQALEFTGFGKPDHEVFFQSR